MLAVVGWILLAVFGLVLVMLALPVQIRFVAATEPRPHFALRVALLGGWVPAIPIERPAAARKKPKQPAKKKTPGRSRRKTDPTALGQALWDLIRDVIGVVHWDGLQVYCRFGAEDPAETGRLYGALMPVLFGGAARLGWDIRLEPDFDRAIFSGRVEAGFRVAPLALAPPAMRFGWRLVRP